MSATIPIEIGHNDAPMPSLMSYAAGPREVPLLRETIGENLKTHRGAISPSARRWSWRISATERRTASCGGRSTGQRVPSSPTA